MHAGPARSRFGAAVVALVALLLVAVGPVAALAPCFPDDGHELGVGTEGPHIELVVHTSLLSNLGGPGALGVEAVGTTGRYEVVSLRTGAVFAGVGDPEAFLADPFSRFGLAFDYRFSLPMLGSGYDYRLDEAPVTGVDGANCTV